MKKLPTVAAAVFGAVMVVAGSSALTQDAPREPSTAALQKRVQRLEGRVDALERLMIAQVAPAADSTAQAEKELQAALEALDYRNRLFRKGYVSKAELQQAEFAVRIARKKLELAQQQTDPATLILQLALLKAEHRRQSAAGVLERVSRFAEQGFVTPAEVEGARAALAEAEKRLQAAREALRQHLRERESSSD